MSLERANFGPQDPRKYLEELNKIASQKVNEVLTEAPRTPVLPSLPRSESSLDGSLFASYIELTGYMLKAQQLIHVGILL